MGGPLNLCQRDGPLFLAMASTTRTLSLQLKEYTNSFEDVTNANQTQEIYRPLYAVWLQREQPLL